MQIDSIYKTVQDLLNKDQLGYLKPMSYNNYLNNAIRKVYNDYLTELKSAVRKNNWHLEGKNMAKYSEHVRQLLEYFSKVTPLTTLNNFADLPTDLEYVEDVYTIANVRIDKVPYSVLIDLQTSIYAAPNDCSPKCSKIGEKLEIYPDIKTIKLHYLRKPKYAKWTFQDDNGKPMFDPTANDFQDVDLPETSIDEVISLTFEMAAIGIRELQLAQLANQEQQTDTQEQQIQ